MKTNGFNQGLGVSRRDFVRRLGAGFGSVALGQLLASDNTSRLDPRAVGHRPHHRPRARRVIQLFMNGGASQMDLFDHKPELFRRAGQPFDPGSSVRIEAPTSEPGKVLKPPVPLRQHGQSGRWVSDLMPNLARCVDDMAFLMAMQSRTNVHGPASYLMNTGSLLPGFPAFGAWVSYALGSEADNLPAFVVLPDTKGLPYNQRGNFSAGFLPVAHQGTLIHAGNPSPMAYLRAPASAQGITPEADREGLALLQQWNRRHLESQDSDPRLEARIQAYELAARMQLSAPEAFDLSAESPATRRLYGLDRPESADFGRRCLMARRLVERGFASSKSGVVPVGRRAIGTTMPIWPRNSRRCVRRPIFRLRDCFRISRPVGFLKTLWCFGTRNLAECPLPRAVKAGTTMVAPSWVGWRGQGCALELPMVKAMSGLGRPLTTSLPPTTSMPRPCICWGWITSV